MCCNSERQECLNKIDYNNHMLGAKKIQYFIDRDLHMY